MLTDTGNALGDLPRPPVLPSGTAPWSSDLCLPTTFTFVYLDEIVTTTFDGLSTTVCVTTYNHRSPHNKYNCGPDEHVQDFTDSDDDSDDDIPDLMDPDDEDMP